MLPKMTKPDDVIDVRLNRVFTRDEIYEMVEWLHVHHVRMIRFDSGQIGRPEDLLTYSGQRHINARVYFEGQDDLAILFKLKFS